MRIPLLELLKNLRRGKPGGWRCPSCGSADVRGSSPLGGWLTPADYCADCGYSGPVVLEEEKQKGD